MLSLHFRQHELAGKSKPRGWVGQGLVLSDAPLHLANRRGQGRDMLPAGTEPMHSNFAIHAKPDCLRAHLRETMQQER